MRRRWPRARRRRPLAEPAPGHDPAWKPFGDDAADRLDFVTAHRGRAGLDLIDARRGERPRDGELLARRERDARRLFAVAQRGVVDDICEGGRRSRRHSGINGVEGVRSLVRARPEGRQLAQFFEDAGSASITRSTSSGDIVAREARSGSRHARRVKGTFIARSTCDGSSEPDVQAEPDDAAMPGAIEQQQDGFALDIFEGDVRGVRQAFARIAD